MDVAPTELYALVSPRDVAKLYVLPSYFGRIDPSVAYDKVPNQMASIGFTYWQDGETWLGYLDRYPDYMTQGTSLDDLKEHLLDLYKDLSAGVIPGVRQHAELELA
jgi:hypothetical protein